MHAAQTQANAKLKEVTEKAKLFIRDNSQQFVGRGLLWTVPAHFPQWIELWTTLEGPSQMGFGQPEPHQQGIQTILMPQQNYQNVQNVGISDQQGYLANSSMQQKQYDGNTFSANV